MKKIRLIQLVLFLTLLVTMQSAPLRAGLGLPGLGSSGAGCGAGNFVGFSNGATGSSAGDAGGSDSGSDQGSAGFEFQGPVDIPITIAKNVDGVDATSARFTPSGTNSLSTPLQLKSRKLIKTTTIGSGDVVGTASFSTINLTEENVAVVRNGAVVATIFAAGGNFEIEITSDILGQSFALLGMQGDTGSWPIIVKVDDDEVVGGITMSVSISNIDHVNPYLAFAPDGNVAITGAIADGENAIATINYLGGEPQILTLLDNPAIKLQYSYNSDLFWVDETDNKLCTYTASTVVCDGLSQAEPDALSFVISADGTHVVSNSSLSDTEETFSVYNTSSAALSQASTLGITDTALTLDWVDLNDISYTIAIGGSGEGTYAATAFDMTDFLSGAAPSLAPFSLFNAAYAISDPVATSKGVYYLCDDGDLGYIHICYTTYQGSFTRFIDFDQNVCSVKNFTIAADETYILFDMDCLEENTGNAELGGRFIGLMYTADRLGCFVINGNHPVVDPENPQIISYISPAAQANILNIDNDPFMQCYENSGSGLCPENFTFNCATIEDEDACGTYYMNTGYYTVYGETDGYRKCYWHEGACNYYGGEQSCDTQGLDPYQGERIDHCTDGRTYTSACSEIHNSQDCWTHYTEGYLADDYVNCEWSGAACSDGDNCTEGPVCGNGTCESDRETVEQCPADCAPDESTNTGDAVVLVSGATKALNSTTDEDYYTLTIVTANNYTLSVAGLVSTSDPVLTIYDGVPTQIATNYADNTWGGGANIQSCLSGYLSAGTYYIKVSSHSSSVGSYVITQTSSSLGCSTTNGQLSTAFADVSAIGAGDSSGYIVKTDGSLYGFGKNADGQLGDNTTTAKTVATQVVGVAAVGNLSDVTVAVGGESHTLALNNIGRLYAWGDNAYGQLGNSGDPTDSSSPVQIVANGVEGIAAGNYFSLYMDGGNVYSWGLNSSGQLGNNSTNSASAPVGVLTGGLVAITNIVDIVAGDSSAYAIKNDGTLWAWGANNYGQLGDGSTNQSQVAIQTAVLTDVIQVDGGETHAVALKSDGTVYSWGFYSWYQHWYDAGAAHNTAIDSPTPVLVSGLTNVIAIAANDNASYALKDDGTVWAWGSNEYYALGNGTTTASLIPVQVPGITTATAIAAGGDWAMVTLSDNTVLVWGFMGDHQSSVGLGPNASATTPKVLIQP